MPTQVGVRRNERQVLWSMGSKGKPTLSWKQLPTEFDESGVGFYAKANMYVVMAVLKTRYALCFLLSIRK